VQKAAAQDAARHQDPATTTMYVKLGDMEIRSGVAPRAPTRLFTVAQYNPVSWALIFFGVPLDDFLPGAGP
jgi:hypothetical protein